MEFDSIKQLREHFATYPVVTQQGIEAAIAFGALAAQASPLGTKIARDGHDYGSQLDPGIKREVEILNENGIETFESCQGGDGHCYAEPTIRFAGNRSEGYRALTVALQHGLRVDSLRRTWPMVDGEPTGPYWEMTFHVTRA